MAPLAADWGRRLPFSFREELLWFAMDRGMENTDVDGLFCVAADAGRVKSASGCAVWASQSWVRW